MDGGGGESRLKMFHEGERGVGIRSTQHREVLTPSTLSSTALPQIISVLFSATVGRYHTGKRITWFISHDYCNPVQRAIFVPSVLLRCSLASYYLPLCILCVSGVELKWGVFFSIVQCACGVFVLPGGAGTPYLSCLVACAPSMVPWVCAVFPMKTE